MNIYITDAALAHFTKLILKENVVGMGLRMFLETPGSPVAEVGITFCPLEDVQKEDLTIEYSSFILYIDKASQHYLEEAKIDYQYDNLGGQLVITAPNLRGHKPGDTSDLTEKVTYLLNTEINPNLAGHGGMVSLVEVTDKREVVLRFGGGCHGCGMVDVTLKHGIEKTLKEQLPEITSIIDVTDHSQGDNPYY